MGEDFSRQTRSVSTATLTYGKGKRRGMADRGPGEIEDFVGNGAFGIAGGGTSGVSSDEDRPDGVQRL